MTKAEIVQFVAQWEVIWGMNDARAISIILSALDQTHEVPGAVVEMGCHFGTTSLFLRRYMDRYMPDKALHLYDGFRGLPERTVEDGPEPMRYVKGACCAGADLLIKHFLEAGLVLPTVHAGWFADATYPDVISFAFFDADLFQPTMDSFAHVWPRLSIGGRVVVHDVGLVGCGTRRACETFGHPWTEEYGCATLVKTA
jgi:O-methyltransferase